MPDDRTTVTELGTALGTLPYPDPVKALACRPGQLHVGEDVWDHLDAIVGSGRFTAELDTAFANGRALLEAHDGLRGRPPLIIEWTGGRRPPGDEVAPIDLRIDHVYLVSCKYESDILANASPARVFDGLLATTGSWDRGDWYEAVAPVRVHRPLPGLPGRGGARATSRPHRPSAAASSWSCCATPCGDAPIPTPRPATPMGSCAGR